PPLQCVPLRSNASPDEVSTTGAYRHSIGRIIIVTGRRDCAYSLGALRLRVIKIAIFRRAKQRLLLIQRPRLGRRLPGNGPRLCGIIAGTSFVLMSAFVLRS